MARQFDWYTGQLVAHQDMDAAFQNLEDADHALMVDAGFTGIFSGFVATEHVGTANMTVDITAGVAYSPDGERIVSAASLTVTCAFDYLGNATAVQNSGKSKKLGIYILFDRLPSDPRTDATNNTVYFVQDETIVVQVVQGAEATVPSVPAAPVGGVLIAHVTLTYGQTSILNASLSTASRGDQIVITGASLSGRWGRVINALQGYADFINLFISGGGGAATIPATSVMYAGGGGWADASSTPAASVEATIDLLSTWIGGTGVSIGGDAKIGVWTDSGAAYTLSAGALRTRLQQLRGADAIVYAGSPAWADATTIVTSSVEAAIDAIPTKLGGSGGAGALGFAGVGNFTSGTVFGGFQQLTFTSGGNDGALRIGTQPDGNFAGVTVRAQFHELTLTSSGDDGAKRVGANVTSGFTAGKNTVRLQLDDLQTLKAPIASPTFTGVVTAPTYELTAAAVTRVQRAPLYQGSSFFHRSLSVAAGATVRQVLDLPHASTLTAVAMRYSSAPHGGMPATLLSEISVYKIDSTNGASTLIGSAFDSSANTAALNAAHDVAATGLTEVIDAQLYTYEVLYTQESGTNALSATVYTARTTCTPTSIDPG